MVYFVSETGRNKLFLLSYRHAVWELLFNMLLYLSPYQMFCFMFILTKYLIYFHHNRYEFYLEVETSRLFL